MYEVLLPCHDEFVKYDEPNGYQCGTLIEHTLHVQQQKKFFLCMKYGDLKLSLNESQSILKLEDELLNGVWMSLCWQVNDGEIQQRRRYLEQQRDRLLAHKKC